jgi:hypothetical protein
MEATPIKIHPLWAKDETALMKRLHQVISGTSDGPFQKDSGYKWQLDASNDWWAELRGDELILACRYNQAKLEALAAFCTHLLS